MDRARIPSKRSGAARPRRGPGPSSRRRRTRTPVPPSFPRGLTSVASDRARARRRRWNAGVECSSGRVRVWRSAEKAKRSEDDAGGGDLQRRLALATANRDESWRAKVMDVARASRRATRAPYYSFAENSSAPALTRVARRKTARIVDETRLETTNRERADASRGVCRRASAARRLATRRRKADLPRAASLRWSGSRSTRSQSVGGRASSPSTAPPAPRGAQEAERRLADLELQLGHHRRTPRSPRREGRGCRLRRKREDFIAAISRLRQRSMRSRQTPPRCTSTALNSPPRVELRRAAPALTSASAFARRTHSSPRKQLHAARYLPRLPSR